MFQRGYVTCLILRDTGSGWTEIQSLSCQPLGRSFLLIIFFSDSNFQKQYYYMRDYGVIVWALFLSL